MPVPDMTVHRDPPPFSRHGKRAGEHLVSAQYERLPDGARGRLAADMALFYAELHALDARAMDAAGAGPISSSPTGRRGSCDTPAAAPYNDSGVQHQDRVS